MPSNTELKRRKAIKNPAANKLKQDKETAALKRNNKREEEKKAFLKLQLEKEQSAMEEKRKNNTNEKNERIITIWESVRTTEISYGLPFANFRIGNIFNEHSLITTLFQDVDVVTDCMITLMWIILYNGKAYISSGNINDNTSVLDQYKNENKYTVIFEGSSQESFSTYPFQGKVVYGERLGEKVHFLNTSVPHSFLPGCVMKKMIEKGLVTPIFYC